MTSEAVALARAVLEFNRTCPLPFYLRKHVEPLVAQATQIIVSASESSELRYRVEWNGEQDAGINAGSEDVAIRFSHTKTLDEEVVEMFRETLLQYYDGAHVMTEQEYERYSEQIEAEERRLEDDND